MQTVKEKMQEEEFYHADGVILKTNQELQDIIKDFGHGVTKFHTVDVCRLLVENEKLKASVVIFEASKTYHELPNDNSAEYNEGYVKCCNNIINRMSEI